MFVVSVPQRNTVNLYIENPSHSLSVAVTETFIFLLLLINFIKQNRSCVISLAPQVIFEIETNETTASNNVRTCVSYLHKFDEDFTFDKMFGIIRAIRFY